MKATKKIVGAACALVAAVALSAGTTFAWFVSNASVTATGLKVDVATSNSYLVISDGYSSLRTSNLKTISLAPSGDATKLKPSAHKEVVSDSPSSDQITANDLTTVTSWYEGKGTSPADGTLSGDKVTLSSFDGYVVQDDIFVSVATGSDAVDHVKLKMTLIDPETGGSASWDTTLGNSAISVVILYQNIQNDGIASNWSYVEAKGGKEGGVEVGNNHSISSEPDGMLDLGRVTQEDYFQIRVMVYFNGNNDDVKGINAAKLEGVTLNFEFVDGASIT